MLNSLTPSADLVQRIPLCQVSDLYDPKKEHQFWQLNKNDIGKKTWTINNCVTGYWLPQNKVLFYVSDTG